MLEVVCHQHVLVKSREKVPITACNGTHLACWTRHVGRMMPHIYRKSQNVGNFSHSTIYSKNPHMIKSHFIVSLSTYHMSLFTIVS